MSIRENVAFGPSFQNMALDERVDAVLSAITLKEFEEVTTSAQNAFRLTYRYGAEHKFGIKAIITRRDFLFSDGISHVTRFFMIFHTLGHYYFISKAAQIGIDRYKYIYDTFENTNLHVYEQADVKAIEGARVVTENVRIDRTEFEVRANDYAGLLLNYLGYGHLAPIIKLYEPADVKYILDVTEGGKDAIVPTDRDYLERYVCAGKSIVDGENVEGIYTDKNFKVDNVDWDLLDKSKLEIHFF